MSRNVAASGGKGGQRGAGPGNNCQRTGEVDIGAVLPIFQSLSTAHLQGREKSAHNSESQRVARAKVVSRNGCGEFNVSWLHSITVPEVRTNDVTSTFKAQNAVTREVDVRVLVVKAVLHGEGEEEEAVAV